MKFRRRFRRVALLGQLGPGLVTGAADDDPSGIATYSQAGAQFGFGLLWTMLLTYPLMSAVQLISAQIGRVTGKGLASNMGALLPHWLVTGLVALLFLANTVNIGADLAAMGAAGEMVSGIDSHILTVVLALLSLTLQLFVPYRRYATLLKWLTLALLAYVAVLLFVKLDWGQVVRGLVVPRIEGTGAIVTIVALFGTTISPYLFFWQSAQEVEDLDGDQHAEPLKDAPWQARRQFRRMNVDTWAGMAFSNVVALAIMIATAATLHATGHDQIDTAADAARALQPVAGRFAFLLFAIGIVGTGFLAVPVLAGSAAFAVAESRGWDCGLEYKPREAVGFYAVIGAATVLGIAIDWSPLDPIKALFWSAVVNGVIAVPIMAAMMLVASRHRTMGKFTASPWLMRGGWAATLVMGVASVAMLMTM
ncbi:divalent metal cation transporter [uncultured Sphingomonas sp.]|uniref:NRAMP family divalent metal transporter n=1 Tax=uncultured Sphingomonas sp. TaxID=158754 RepID=UPI0026011871|nr:divalent metal cation transporter [uncultured Sphingomonas sp.]